MRAGLPEWLMMLPLMITRGFIDDWRKEMEREKGTAWPLLLWLFANPLAATAPPPTPTFTSI